MRSLLGLLLTLLVTTQAFAVTMVTDVRTGEADGKVRFVVASDASRQWSATFRGNELVLVTQDAQTVLKPMAALRARQLGQISFKQAGNVFGVHIVLNQPMRIVATQQIPAKAGQDARWVVDMVVDQEKVAQLQAIKQAEAAKLAAAKKLAMVKPIIANKVDTKTVVETATIVPPVAAPAVTAAVAPVVTATVAPVPVAEAAAEQTTKTATVAVAAIKAVIKEKNDASSKPVVAKTVAEVPSSKTSPEPKVLTHVQKLTPLASKKVAPITPLESLAQTNEEREVPIDVVARQIRTNIEPFKGTKPLVVAIDAGHGGKDVGAISISGKLEKDLTLAMAKELKRQIDAQPGMRAVLTRDKDYFIPLRDRPKLARAMGADVFISLHADSYKDPNISGASFYVASPNGATSQLAKFVASHSNNADTAAEVGLDPWSESLATNIGRMSMEASMEDSHNLASFMQDSMKKSKIRLQHSKVQSANFMVLKNIDMPSVLIETGFVSNPKQDKLMQDVRFHTKLASTIVDGLCDFAKAQPEPGIVYANLKVHKGDTIAAIAQRHGISNAYLAKANNLDEKSALKEGQKIRVPVNVTRRTAMLVDSRG
jgi:N-acetylmuramoyl-L-alanine amidase